MPALAEAFIRIRADTTQARREAESGFDESGRRAGQSFGDGFTRDASGRLRGARLPAPNIDAPRMPPLPDPPDIHVGVDVDTSAARSALAGLLTDISRLAAIPVGATVGVGLAGLAGGFAAAAAGAGGLAAVAIPALTKIKEATAAQTAASKSSTGADAASQAQTFALAGARQALAAALRNSSFAHAQALEGVKRAERDLTDAQRSAVDVERQLGRARQDAQRQLQDMANQVASTRLSVRQSQLDITSAQSDYNKVLADPQATNAQKEQAKLAIDQAKQRLKEQQLALQRLEQDEKKAAKSGVEGSDQVRNARDQLAKANQKVTDTERALAKARADVARTDKNSADSVASARRALLQASIKPGGGASPADQLLAQLTPDEKKLKTSLDGLSTTWKAWQVSMQPTVLPLVSQGIGILKSQIPSLTPIVKGAAEAVGGLLDRVAVAAKSPEFKQFKAQFADLVPTSITGLGNIIGDIVTGFGRLFQAFLPYAPAAIKFLEDLAQKFADWSKQQTGDQGSGFQKFLDWVKNNGPAVLKTAEDIAAAIGKVTTSLAPIAGVLGLGALSTFGLLAKVILTLSPGQIQTLAIAFVAFKTAMTGYKVVDTAVTSITAFRAAMSAAAAGESAPLWARGLNAVWTGMKSLGSSIKTAVTSLWTYVRAQTASAAATARAKLAAAGSWIADQAVALRAVAAAQLSSARAATASALATARARIATVASTVAASAAALATKAWAAATWLFNAAMDANPIGLIVIALVALVAAVILAYKHSETFRNIVQAAWAGIQAAVSAAWGFIQPIFAAIGAWITGTLMPLFTRLWQNVIQPAFVGIGNIISAAWSGVIQPALQAIWNFIQNVLAPIFMWLWNNVIQPAFQGIGQVISAAWNGLIRPALQAIWTFIQTVLAPVFMWLWNNVIQPAFAGIGTVISTIWTGVIRPVFNALWTFIQTVLAPVFTWLWNTIIAPAFAGIGLVISAGWNNVIKPIFTAIWTFLKNTLGPVFTWLWNTIIKPAWDGISALISAGWNNGIKPIFDFLMKGVQAIGASFGTAVEIIKQSWSKIQDVTKGPVNFVIETVYGKGIKGLWNTIIGWLHLPDSLKLGDIPKLAKGGTLANPAAASPMMTNGPMAIVGEGNPNHPEFVIPTDPKYRGRAQAMMVSAARRMNMQVLAPGGILGLGGDPWDAIKNFAGDVTDLAGDAIDLITNPKKVWDKLAGAIPKPNFEGGFGQAVNAIPKKILDEMWGVAEKVIKAFGDGYGGKGVDGALKWARKQVGKPYLWGGAGPGGYDCSGFMGSIVRVIQGAKDPYQRMFSTDSFNAAGGPGFARNGKSAFTVGVTHAGVGHMAGTLNGVNVESSGGVGVRVGGGARGTGDGLFPYKYGYKFDTGGLLPPGPINHTTRPEPVLTTRQWSALLTLAERGATARTGPLIGEAHIREEIDADRFAARLSFLERTGSF